METKGPLCGATSDNPKLCSTTTFSREVIPLNDWTFRRGDELDSRFWPVAQFPTNIHLDLLRNGMIPDPFIGKNEADVQWVGEKTWVYRTEFPSPGTVPGRAVLAFDGLDTYATAVLNGREILKTEDMFIPERVDVTRHLQPAAGDNVLEITFDSAYLIGKKIVEDNPVHRWGCWNGDPSRLAVRKAQYHYVWLMITYGAYLGLQGGKKFRADESTI